MLVDRCIGAEDGVLEQRGVDGLVLVPAFGGVLIPHAVSKEFEVIQRVAVEGLAERAALEFVGAVDIHQAVEEREVAASLAREVAGPGTLELEATAKTGLQDGDAVVEEAKVQTQS